MFIAHGPLSALISEKIREKYFSNIKKTFIPLLFLFSLLTGILPDFDFFIQAARSEPAFLHHNLITHTPIFWVLASILVYIILKIIERLSIKNISEFLKGGGTNLISLSFLLGTLSHIFSDMLTGHIMVFYPFSDQGYSIGSWLLPINPTVTYFIHPAMVIELVIVAIFILHFGKKIFSYIERNKKILSIAIYSIGILALGLSIWVYRNTYTTVLPSDSQNMPNYDRDQDSIDDYKDPDFNNNGIDNLDDSDRELITENIKRIVDSKKATTYNNGTLERFGWLSSYGTISTAFYEAGYTIEPVIKIHFKENENIRFNLISLHQVLKERNRLADINIESIGNLPGRIFFIIEDDRVINAGYIVDQNNIAIVLPMQRQLAMHTIDSVREMYPEGTSIQIER